MVVPSPPSLPFCLSVPDWWARVCVICVECSSIPTAFVHGNVRAPHCADRIRLYCALQVMGGDVRFKAMDNLPKLTPAPPQEKKEKK